MKNLKYIILALGLLATMNLSSAQNRHSRFLIGAQGGWQWFSDTYSHSGYAVNVNADYKFHKTFYASFIGHLGSYEGHVSREILVSGEPMDERFSDSVGEWMFGIGPGADLISNNRDRIFVCLYAGVAGAERKSETFNDEGGYKEFPKEKPIGFGAIAQFGYEHCFRSGFTLGGNVSGIYSIDRIYWGVNLSFGFSF